MYADASRTSVSGSALSPCPTAATLPPAKPTSVTASSFWEGSITRPPRRIKSKGITISNCDTSHRRCHAGRLCATEHGIGAYASAGRQQDVDGRDARDDALRAFGPAVSPTCGYRDGEEHDLPQPCWHEPCMAECNRVLA